MGGLYEVGVSQTEYTRKLIPEFNQIRLALCLWISLYGQTDIRRLLSSVTWHRVIWQIDGLFQRNLLL